MVIKVLDRVAMGLDTPIDVLESIGDVTVYDHTLPQQVIERALDADVLVLNKIKITDEIISSCKKLKLICVFATGYDNIDIISAREHGVAVCNVPGYSTDSVMLFTIATVAALSSHLLEYNSFVSSGAYSESNSANKLTPVYHEISGKTWGVVGYGNIGKSVAGVAKAMGARVIVNKRTPTNEFRCVDIDTLCRESDIITIHCPLNGETRHLINSDRIALMKKDVIIVNEARGLVTDEGAIAQAILDGRIGAFGADVYSEEPFKESHPFNSIKDLPNVILTPHCAWGSYEARSRCINIIKQNIEDFSNCIKTNRIV